MAFCPQCRSEYREGVQTCPSCGAALIDVLPPLPKRPAILVPRLKRFFPRFAGRDTSPPRLQSFLLEQPPDWRHTALALVLAVAMTQAGIGNTVLLRGVFAPVRGDPKWLAAQVGFSVPLAQRLTPLVIAGVFIGSAALGLAAALIARRREWLWGPIALCIGVAVEFLWVRLYYPYGSPVPSKAHPGLFFTWRLQPDLLGLPLVVGALVCAAIGGSLATTRVRRWSVGVVTLCIAMSAVGAYWNGVTLIGFATGHTYWGARLPIYMYRLVDNTPYLLTGFWVGWAMRRWGVVWGAALWLLPLYKSLSRWSPPRAL